MCDDSLQRQKAGVKQKYKDEYIEVGDRQAKDTASTSGYPWPGTILNLNPRQQAQKEADYFAQKSVENNKHAVSQQKLADFYAAHPEFAEFVTLTGIR